MEDGSCWWLDPENPGNAQPKPKKTCNVSEISVQKKQAYLKFGNSPSTNQQVVPYQLWKPQFHVRKVEWNLEWSSVSFIRFVFSTWSAPKEDLRSQLRHFESAASEHETAQVGETDHLFRIDGKGNQRKKSIISGDNLYLVLGLRGCLRVFQSCRFFFSFPF